MKVSDFKTFISLLPESADDYEVKVWLPGSTISLACFIGLSGSRKLLTIEGNVDDGSALERLVEQLCAEEQAASEGDARLSVSPVQERETTD